MASLQWGWAVGPASVPAASEQTWPSGIPVAAAQPSNSHAGWWDCNRCKDTVKVGAHEQIRDCRICLPEKRCVCDTLSVKAELCGISVFLSLFAITFYGSSANTAHWREAWIQQTSREDCSVHVSVLYRQLHFRYGNVETDTLLKLITCLWYINWAVFLIPAS